MKAFKFSMPKTRPKKNQAYDSNGIGWYDFGSNQQHPCVYTPRGRSAIKGGDWVINIDGEFYVLTDNAFHILTRGK